MIARIHQALTGKPWTTVRSMAAEYGPPPGARYATQLANYTDADLIRHGDRILARLRAGELATVQGTPAADPAWEGTCDCEDLEVHDPDCDADCLVAGPAARVRYDRWPSVRLGWTGGDS